MTPIEKTIVTLLKEMSGGDPTILDEFASAVSQATRDGNLVSRCALIASSEVKSEAVPSRKNR